MYRKQPLWKIHMMRSVPTAGAVSLFLTLAVKAEGLASGQEMAAAVQPANALLATAVVLAAGVLAYIKRNKFN